MAFLDKLRKTVENVKNSVNLEGTIENVKNSITQAGVLINTSIEPLFDDVENKYYEIAYGLFASIENVGKSHDYIHGILFDGVKNYIEYHTGEECDTVKLQKVLNYYRTYKPSISGYNDENIFYSSLGSDVSVKIRLEGKIPTSQIQKVQALNSILAEKQTYRCSYEEAIKICYNDILEKIISEYENVFSVVETHGIKHYREGLCKIENKYANIIGKSEFYRQIRLLTHNKYIEDDYTAKVILLSYLLVDLKNRKSREAAAFLILRGMHFQSYKDFHEEYTTITEDMCCNFVLNNDYYKDEIDKHPYDIQEYTERFTKNIFNSYISPGTHYWMPDKKTDVYYFDSVCNLSLKDIVARYTNVLPTDFNEIFEMVWDFVNS